MADPRSDHLVVATVRKPHGIRGELKLALETDRPRAVFRPGRVLQVGDASGRPTGAVLTVQTARPLPDGLLLKTVEHGALGPALESLRGVTLLIPRSEAEPAAPDEVLYTDLVGLTVVSEGRPLGTVQQVLELGGGETLAVRRPRGGELLLPFVKAMVRRVDLERRELEMELPEGLLDL